MKEKFKPGDLVLLRDLSDLLEDFPRLNKKIREYAGKSVTISCFEECDDDADSVWFSEISGDYMIPEEGWTTELIKNKIDDIKKYRRPKKGR